jgi:acetylornithine/succinyldiaminopimelate/putrescine aminotransferase
MRQLFLHHLAQTSDIPLMLEIEKAEGSFLFDKSGKAYLDLVSGISVSVLGHRHPAVIEAISGQLDKYLHTLVYGEYVLAPQVQLAELLSQTFESRILSPEFESPYGRLKSSFFVNSGSEAVEGAMKLAKRFTGRHKIAAFRNAYHGSTHGAASLMSPTTYTQAYFPLLPGIVHLNFNDAGDLDFITDEIAAVIAEPVQAEAGVLAPENDFLKKLRKKCTETGTLLILDEIQTGYGRTGKLWAFEKYGIEPDILLLAKSMGGGMPIGAFISSKEVMRHLSFDPPLGHITTFGGHPVSCAAALATLKTILGSELISKVPQKEELLKDGLNHPAIKEIRSVGLLMALELKDFDTVRKVSVDCLENGVVTDWFLFNSHCLRIAPPLTISEDEIKKACIVIQSALDKVR